MPVIFWFFLTALLVFAGVNALLTAVSLYYQRRYRGKRAVTDSQWESWAVDTVEWTIEEDHDEQDSAEERGGTGRTDPVAPDVLLDAKSRSVRGNQAKVPTPRAR